MLNLLQVILILFFTNVAAKLNEKIVKAKNHFPIILPRLLMKLSSLTKKIMEKVMRN